MSYEEMQAIEVSSVYSIEIDDITLDEVEQLENELYQEA